MHATTASRSGARAPRPPRVPRVPRVFVADLPAEHLDELEFLWMQTLGARGIAGATVRWLHDLRARMRANALGVEVAGKRAHELLGEALAGKERALAAAATHVLLCAKDAAGHALVLDAIGSAKPAARDGIREAFLRGPSPALDGKRLALASSAPPDAAVVYAEVFAAHGAQVPKLPLRDWLAHESAAVRAGACRVAAWTNAEAAALEPLARDDEDASVRREAIEAGAWLRAPWVAAHGRASAQSRRADRAEAVLMGCLLAGSGDGALVKGVADDAALGPARFAYAAAWGRPAVFEWLLAEMGAKDAKDAEAAGAAFVRMAGKDLPTARQGDAAEGEAEAILVDAARAKALWGERRAVWEQGRRWAGGFDAGQSLDGANALDLKSRHETLLRGRHRDEWPGTRRDFLLLD